MEFDTEDLSLVLFYLIIFFLFFFILFYFISFHFILFYFIFSDGSLPRTMTSRKKCCTIHSPHSETSCPAKSSMKVMEVVIAGNSNK